MLISCGEINKSLLFIIIGGICRLIYHIISFNLDIELNKYPIFKGLSVGLFMSLSFFPYIYIKLISKNRNNKNELKIDKSFYKKEYEKFNNKKSFRISKYLFILLCSFLDCIEKILAFVIILDENNHIWIFNLIFTSIFSYFILNTKLYKHQYCISAILIVLCLALQILYFIDFNIYKLYKNFEALIIELIYCLNSVIIKYAMEYKFCTPYEICFFEGFFAFIINIILLIIVSNIEIRKDSNLTHFLVTIEYNNKIYIDNYHSFFDEINKKELLLYFAILLNRFLFNLFALITTKYFTPCHLVLLMMIGDGYLSFKSKKDLKLYITIIIFWIIIFCVLVYTEIIELNFWNLEKNTKKNISKRANIKENEGIYDEEIINDLNDSNEIDGFEIGTVKEFDE